MSTKSTPIDVERARHETRGCAGIVHLNHAGSSLMPIPVADALIGWQREEEFRGGYETADRHQDKLENFYDATARLLNCSRDEVAFVENATRAWDMAFYALDLGKGDRILTTESEYGSNMIAYLHRAKHTGCEVAIVPNDNHGQIDVAALDRMVDDRVKLISISHVPTGGGLVNPAAEVGRVAGKHGVPYLLDACQSAGQIPLDVAEIGCDFLSATGRKYLRGPRGTGFLYVRGDWIERLDPPLLDQHAAELVNEREYVVRADARRFENWECHFAGKAALGVAIDYALGWGLEAIRDRVQPLAQQLRDRLSGLDGVEVLDEGAEKCGIVTFRKRGEEADAIKRRLKDHGINVSVSGDSGARVGYDRRGIATAVRASVHYITLEREIDALVRVVGEGA
ncbi:aminotransferase class V-fold PLP-dependent enzyme [Thalassobaculum sp. OXR-137]|uniref:aminotransferase class V-fold PLP-dependent enzyme n=1 Tax=Thalassobaculum sp. OXR-137 TaxID=3100173 RepID=UPI002AC980F4|nr:aminotransferase class V-fold PLP-dependent enzyme [Thalassobaculum sp. OXR-137]WPZ34277.1 aminotransferase class V-fold PLP-dependent enzyme [Thalassobaculum sp. OXR-137]